VALGVAEGLRPDIEDAGLALSVDVASGPVVVDGDADRLAQVAGNLVENAARHASRAVVVAVSPSPDGRDAVLVVDDDGPGIPLAERERVFEPLYTRRAAGHADTGTGLGLATVRALTEAMHGTVTASSSPTGGARLTVRLPIAPPR
jgi:signal transduction histidine kinase